MGVGDGRGKEWERWASQQWGRRAECLPEGAGAAGPGAVAKLRQEADRAFGAMPKG